MNEDDPETVKRMLLYLYTLDYPDGNMLNIPADHVATDISLPPRLQRMASTITEEKADMGMTSAPFEGLTPEDPKRLNNVSVYAIADKYDIAELKELARRKFLALMGNELTNVEFEAVRDAVFGTTPSHDRGLRHIVCQFCIDHFEYIIKDTRLRSLVLNNEELAHTMPEHAMLGKTKDMQLLDETLAKKLSLQDEVLAAKGVAQRALDQKSKRELVLQQELAKAKAEVQTLLHQKSNLLSTFNALVDNVNYWERCRNCGEDFSSSWIERFQSSDDSQFQLRCSHCRCRHDI